jgi:energy-converting hydrogenase Eha subunit E
VTATAPEASDPGTGPLPPTLMWAVRLLYGEAAVVGIIAIYLAYQDIAGGAVDLRAAIFVTLYAAAMAAVLGGLAYALSRRRPWARGPAVALQLMLLPIGYYLTIGGLPWFGVPVGVIGLVAGGLLVTPSSARGLGIRFRS